MINMIHDQLRRDSEWAVFEVNNPHLWDALTGTSVPVGELEAGVLIAWEMIRSTKWFNRDNNAMIHRDAGQVNVDVMIRPVGTTERVLIDLCIGGDV